MDFSGQAEEEKESSSQKVNTWAPLWSGIVDSSLWDENSDVCKVFISMLAVKDSDHVCRLDTYRLAKKCNFKKPDGSVDELKVLDILRVLASPDKQRKVKQEFEGRRIKAVEDGWLVLNGEKYREKVIEEMRKARLRRAQEAFRRRLKEKAEKEEAPLTEKEHSEYQQIKNDSHRKRRKYLKNSAICHGARQAIVEGVAETKSQL